MNYRNEYCAHRAKAETRGIPWEISYEEWLGVWVESGRLPHRGRGNGKYAMGRIGDRGPYKVGNVKIVENIENTLEYVAARRYAAAPRALSGRRHRDLNFSDGRVDLMDPLELLQIAEAGVDKVL